MAVIVCRQKIGKMVRLQKQAFQYSCSLSKAFAKHGGQLVCGNVRKSFMKHGKGPEG